MLRGPWWRIFKDPELNALEEQLNINNQNIKQFFQNFMEARALVAEAKAQLYPTLTANASYTRSGSRLCHTDHRDPDGFGSLMGAGSLGESAQRRAVGSIQCPAQRRRSGE